MPRNLSADDIRNATDDRLYTILNHEGRLHPAEVIDLAEAECERRRDAADSKRLASLVESLAQHRERFMDPIVWGEGVNRAFLLSDDLYRIADLLDPQQGAR